MFSFAQRMILLVDKCKYFANSFYKILLKSWFRYQWFFFYDKIRRIMEYVAKKDMGTSAAPYRRAQRDTSQAWLVGGPD